MVWCSLVGRADGDCNMVEKWRIMYGVLIKSDMDMLGRKEDFHYDGEMRL